MRTVPVQQRRSLLVRRHHLGGDADGPEATVRALLALHATDPASVYLSVLARSSGSTLGDVAAAMYERRSLVRWMAMRRTLFVVARDEVPVVQSAVSAPLADRLRRQLLSRLERNGSRPPVPGDVGGWLHSLEEQVEAAVRRRGAATGAELGADVPGLRTIIEPGAPSDRPQAVTSPLLTLMGTQGRIVRGTPTGPWTSRHHRWEPVERWWPAGLPDPGVEHARRTLAQRYLARFGPATVQDLRWWTGWSATTVREALAGVAVEEVDLDGEPGLVLGGDDLAPEAAPPTAALLPALDPTPMGWSRRDWLLGIDRHHVFDRAGNIGPTVWWEGEVIGSWAVAPSGEVRTAVLADRGAEAGRAVEEAAARLHGRLDGAVPTPAARTPLERSLST